MDPGLRMIVHLCRMRSWPGPVTFCHFHLLPDLTVPTTLSGLGVFPRISNHCFKSQQKTKDSSVIYKISFFACYAIFFPTVIVNGTSLVRYQFRLRFTLACNNLSMLFGLKMSEDVFGRQLTHLLLTEPGFVWERLPQHAAGAHNLVQFEGDSSIVVRDRVHCSTTGQSDIIRAAHRLQQLRVRDDGVIAGCVNTFLLCLWLDLCVSVWGSVWRLLVITDQVFYLELL